MSEITVETLIECGKIDDLIKSIKCCNRDYEGCSNDCPRRHNGSKSRLDCKLNLMVQFESILDMFVFENKQLKTELQNHKDVAKEYCQNSEETIKELNDKIKDFSELKNIILTNITLKHNVDIEHLKEQHEKSIIEIQEGKDKKISELLGENERLKSELFYKKQHIENIETLLNQPTPIDPIKPVTQVQMIDWLVKHSNWKAVIIGNSNCIVECVPNQYKSPKDNSVAQLGATIKFANGDKFYITVDMWTKSKWQLIPPGPVEVDFADAYAHYNNGNMIKSLVNNENFLKCSDYSALATVSKEQIRGKWVML